VFGGQRKWGGDDHVEDQRWNQWIESIYTDNKRLTKTVNWSCCEWLWLHTSTDEIALKYNAIVYELRHTCISRRLSLG